MNICVAGILAHNDRILLGKRSENRAFYPNVWDCIGGHCQPGESPEQTLRRELSEELGVLPLIWHSLTVLHDPQPDRHGAYEYVLYLVTKWQGTPQNMAPDEHTEIRWFTVHEAGRLDLAHPDYPTVFSMIDQRAKHVLWESCDERDEE
jgi:mutator protein MutT